MTVSVLTLAHGRAGHLANLVRGLAESRVQPAELIVAVLQPESYDLPEAPFPVRQLRLGGGLNLAAGRNAAARAAIGEGLVFLDVDCIPGPDLVADYARALAMLDALFMGDVLYLPKGAAGTVDFVAFEAVAERHSERAPQPDAFLGDCDDYRCFWSLNFAIRRKTFLDVGGFDETYRGYGGEDTDFGRVVQTAGVPLRWVRGARAYHQYHPHHMPPAHHLDSVLRNAERFRAKWGEYTMGHWLWCFELMGLIAKRGGTYVKLRDPDEADLALTRQAEDRPYASAADVLAVLEARRAPAMAAE